MFGSIAGVLYSISKKLAMQTEEKAGIEFTRVNNDSNGNPRYVCEFTHLLTKEENGYHDGEKYHEPTLTWEQRYPAALKRANKIGGRKFHNKQHGGGIVFQSYNIKQTERDILKIVNG